MVATKPSGGVKPNKRVAAAKIEQLLAGTVSSTDASTLSGMATILARMGVSIPEMAEVPPAQSGQSAKAQASVRVPRLNKTEILMLTLMAKPEQWHMVLRAKTRRANVGLGGLGSCFELVTRSVDGMINHYVRYTTSGIMSPQAHTRYLALQEKLTKIQEAAESGLPVVTKGGFKGKSVSMPQNPYTSLDHARKFPLNPAERKFLEVVSRPNTKILVADHTTKHSYWHTFRWKWQKYGFDLSQISIEQKKQSDGTFNIYATCNGMPGEGVRKLVEFLASKPIAKA